MNIEEVTVDLEQMEQLAYRLASEIGQGDLIFLHGELGTGKTTLVREISEQLGVLDQVLSPSFAVVNIYRGERFPIAHFDLYRLSNSDELEQIGADEFLDGNHLLFVEWPEHGREFFPEPNMEIYISFGSGDDRVIRIERKGM